MKTKIFCDIAELKQIKKFKDQKDPVIPIKYRVFFLPFYKNKKSGSLKCSITDFENTKSK